MAARAEGPRFGAVEFFRERPAIACLGLAVAVSVVLQVALGSNLILFGDDLRLVVERRGTSAHSLLDPFNGHLVVAVLAIHKTLAAAFGISSSTPFHVASALLYALAAAMLFAWARVRVGDWAALLAAVLILFFGASAPALLSPVQMVFSGSLAAGIAMLIALGREDRRGDLAACALLALSIAFSETGFAFAAGAVVQIAVGRPPRAVRLWIVALPLALYGLWLLGWGASEPGAGSIDNLTSAPVYVLEAMATAAGSLTGLSSAADQAPEAVGQGWAPIALATLAVLMGVRLWRLRSVPPGLLVVGAILLVFLLLAALSYVPGQRDPGNGRIVYPTAVIMLMACAECWSGARPRLGALAAGATAVAIAVGMNLVFLVDGYRTYFRAASSLQAAALAGAELAAPSVPARNAGAQTAALLSVDRAAYLRAVADFGSPAYTESELVAAEGVARADADRVLAREVGFAPAAAGEGAGRLAGCDAASIGSGGAVTLYPGTTEVVAGGRGVSALALGRFADGYPVALGAIPAGEARRLEVPHDRSTRPWRLLVDGEAEVLRCG